MTVTEMKCTFEKITEWNQQLFESTLMYICEFGKSPNIIWVNTRTHQIISRLMSREIMTQGLSDQPQEIGEFNHQFGRLEFFIDENLDYKEYVIIFDEETDSRRDFSNNKAFTKTLNLLIKLEKYTNSEGGIRAKKLLDELADMKCKNSEVLIKKADLPLMDDGSKFGMLSIADQIRVEDYIAKLRRKSILCLIK